MPDHLGSDMRKTKDVEKEDEPVKGILLYIFI